MNRSAAHPWLQRSIASLCLAASLSVCDGADPLAGPPVGFLMVWNATEGGAFDLDGFEVGIDGGNAELMEVNDTLAALSLTQGSHTVHLRGLAPNCAASTDPVQEITVESGTTTRLEFTVTCSPPPELASIRIVFARAVGDGSTLVAMNADGSGQVALTSEGSPRLPDVSPDGSRILFTRDREPDAPGPSIYVMNADGTGETRLVAGPADSPRWSPDGSEIVYSIVEHACCEAVHVMRADGSGSAQVTGHDSRWSDSWPAWSPDGTRIAFTRLTYVDLFGGESGIWVVDRDGGAATRLTGGEEAYPVWSASDDRIAFVSFAWGQDGVKVMNSDGSGLTTLVEANPNSGAIPWDWSPDGGLLLFTKNTGPERTDVFLFRVEDRTVVRLTADGARNLTPAFW